MGVSREHLERLRAAYADNPEAGRYLIGGPGGSYTWTAADAREALGLPEHQIELGTPTISTPAQPSLGAGLTLAGLMPTPAMAAAVDPVKQYLARQFDPVALAAGRSMPELESQKADLEKGLKGGDWQDYSGRLPSFGMAGMAPRPKTVGSWSKTTEQRPQPLAGLEDRIRKLAAQKKEGLEDLTAVEQEQARAEAEAMGGTREQMSDLEKRKAAKVAKLQQERDTELRFYQEARQQAAQEKVDPDAWWSNRTAPQKIMALLGVALGAFGEGFTGGRVRNAALKIIDREIDRDIQAQRANIQKKAGERQESLGVVQALGGMIKDEEAAAQNAKVMLMQNLALQMKEKATQLKDRRLAAQFMMNAADLDKGAEMEANKIFMARQPTTRTTAGSRTVSGGGALGGKQIKEGTIDEWGNTLGVVERMEDLARRIKGSKLTPTRQALAWFGTEAGRLVPELRQMSKMIGRTVDKSDVGNLALQEGEDMVKAIAGGEWNKARVAAENLYKRANMAKRLMRDKVYRYHSGGYNVAPLLRGLFSVEGPAQQQPATKEQVQETELGSRL